MSTFGSLMGRRVYLNYGSLPSFEAFDAAFAREVPSGRYRTSIGDDYYNARELYRGVKELIAKYHGSTDAAANAAGDLASSILNTLGFEWI